MSSRSCSTDTTLYLPRQALPVFISAFSITNLPEDRIFQQGDLGVTGMPHPECPSSSEFIISARFPHQPIIKYHDGKHADDRGILPTFLILTILISPMIPDKFFSRFFR